MKRQDAILCIQQCTGLDEFNDFWHYNADGCGLSWQEANDVYFYGRVVERKSAKERKQEAKP